MDAFDARMHETPGPKLPIAGGTERQPTPAATPPTSKHVLHVRPDRPVDIAFSFEQQQSQVGVGASIAAHIALGLIVFLVLRYAPEAQTLDIPQVVDATKIV